MPLLISALILGLYSFKTIDRNKDWKDNYTLYSTDVVNCENSARCQYHYGISLVKDKSLQSKTEQERKNYMQQAIVAYNKAIAILPSYSEAYADLGLAYYRLKNLKAAEKALLKAVKLKPSNATAYSNLGSLYFGLKKYNDAKLAYENAIKYNPTHIDALANYASTLGTLGDYNGAITYFKKAIALNPNEPNYYNMISVSYQNLGNQQQANSWKQKARQIKK